ncbi:MAG: O-antigen ligase domain-containing protein [Lysobacteraceae bacterium]|nr:MAG: O-antigen ligase domain-containing protein [Xanthomonadaceae bacterium]
MFPLMMLYLVLVLIRPQDYPALAGSIPVPVQQLTLVLAAIAWLFSGRRVVSAPQNLLLLVFLLLMMVSIAINGWLGGAIPILRDYAPVVLAYFLLANACFDRRRIVVAMAVTCLCATVLSLHGIEQSATGLGWTGIGLSEGTRIQYVGIFNDPNDLGMLFVMCVPMAIYLSRGGGWMGLRWLLWMVVTGVLVYGIYLTDSRGTILALLAIFGVYVWMKRGIFVAGTLGLIALVALKAMPSRMQELEVGEESAMDRVYSWYEGLQMFQQKPILGVGKGAYTDIYQLTAHNSFILVLAEMGIVGFAVWLAFMGYCFWMMIKAVTWRPDPGKGPEEYGLDAAGVREWGEDRRVAVTLLLALCGFIVSAFFLSRTYVVTIYLFAGIVVAHYACMQGRYRFLPEFKLSKHLLLWPAVAAVGAVALYLVVRVLLLLS